MKGITIFTLVGLALGNWNDEKCEPGRTVMVHLFNWKWTDIEQECTRFLGPQGYCGVQVSPPNEHVYMDSHPWWEQYQPVSYQLESRMGSRDEFISMVKTCNSVGVKIYADAVINHMVGYGREGYGSGGSYYNGVKLYFPAVPYHSIDFNCCWCSRCSTESCNLESYQDANQIRNCRLYGLVDLMHDDPHVQEMILRYLNDLVEIGVSGFRIDAAKHMWPEDLKVIYNSIGDVAIYNEVIDVESDEAVGVKDYLGLGRVTEFKYSFNIGKAFKGEIPLQYLRYFGVESGFVESYHSLVFVDNHDHQRGHGAGGESIVTFQTPREYKMANAFMLAYDYGFTRLMSSYEFGDDSDVGPPSTGDRINDVPIFSNGSCGGGWVCEHRWHAIKNMVAFRNQVNGTSVINWWDNGNNQIAFSRGNSGSLTKGFIAINNEGYPLDEQLHTGLLSGTYCDVYSGDKNRSSCTGASVNVDDSGLAHIYVENGDNPVLAIHEGSRL